MRNFEPNEDDKFDYSYFMNVISSLHSDVMLRTTEIREKLFSM